MNVAIDIDRVAVVIDGLTVDDAEKALVGVDSEIARRLTLISLESVSSIDAGDLTISHEHDAGNLDAGAFRGIVADKIVDALTSRMISR